MLIGHRRHGSYRGYIVGSWHLTVHNPNSRRYCGGRNRTSTLPGQARRQHNSWRRDNHRPSSHHRNDSHSTTCFHDLHACCGKAYREFHCASGDRSQSFCCRTYRSVTFLLNVISVQSSTPDNESSPYVRNRQPKTNF